MRRKLGMAAVGLMAVLMLAVAGMGVVSAQTPTPEADTRYDRFINRVAQLLGKQPAQLESALTQASREQIDQAVEDGELTQAQAERIKARIEETGRPFPLFGRHRGGFGHRGGVFGEVTKVSGSTLTVETPEGSKTVRLTGDTRIRNEGEAAEASAIKVGSVVRVKGEEAENGVVTAEVVKIGELRGPHFRGGRGHHGGPWGDGNNDDSSGESDTEESPSS